MEMKVIKTHPGQSYPEARSLKSLANDSSNTFLTRHLLLVSRTSRGVCRRFDAIKSLQIGS